MNDAIGYFISTIFAIVLISVGYNVIVKPMPVSDNIPALPKHFESNNALLMTCKSIGSGNLSRCKNWEMVCYDFGSWGQCFPLNLPKQLHWKKHD